MPQIIKQILLSHKHNPSKYKTQFVNDNFIYYTCLALLEKVKKKQQGGKFFFTAF